MDFRRMKQRTDPKHNPRPKGSSESKTYRSNDEGYGSSRRNDSNLDPRKKHGPLRKNIAQGRIDRLRKTFTAKSEFSDKIGKLQNAECGNRQKKSDVIREKFIPHATFKSTKYSADARIKKIRQDSLKLLAKERNCSVSKTSDESGTSVKCRASTVSKEFAKPQISTEPKAPRTVCYTKPRNTIEAKVEAVIDNDSMDVDVDPSEVKSSSNRNSFANKIDHSWMDDEKSNVQFINHEISKLRKESVYLASHENFVSDVVMNLDVPAGDLLIVIDTNIFLSHLPFLNKLLECDLLPYKRPVVVVPWPVIQEIDYTMKKDNGRLSCAARSANKFIYDCLKKKHPRFFGQSLDDFKINFQNAVNIDDFILQYCMKFASMETNVILVTNDINLCNKSMINHLNVFTKDDFEKSFGISHT